MRAQAQLLLLIPALITPFVSAVPSLDHGQQHLAQQPAPHRPAWRTVSDTIIKKVWGLNDPPRARPAGGPARPKHNAPAQAMARYGGDMVLRFNITNAQEAKSLSEAADTLFLDVWEYSEQWVDIRLAKDILPSLLGLLPDSLQHSHTPLMYEHQLAQAIYDTYPSPRTAGPRDAPPQPPRANGFSPELRVSNDAESNIFFEDYQPLSVIHPWLRLLSSLFTTHVRPVNVGISYEGRDISGLRVGVHPTNDDAGSPPRKTILITGGLHAREWISTSTVNYIAYSLITGYGKSAAITKLLENFDFVFIPTVNPDGYVYSWENDRLWRKNRQQTSLRFCRGLDLDRSFGFQWDGSSTAGNPCSESFAGSAPFEAVESQRLAEWARNETDSNNVQWVGFLDLHSYSQQILYPYSYSCDEEPPSVEDLQELASGLAKAVRMNRGRSYQIAQACEGNVAVSEGGDGKKQVFPRFEQGGGSALDWFYHELRVKYAYQIKLRDRGSYGFLLPREHIVPTGHEMMEAVMHFGRYLSDEYDLAQVSEAREESADASSDVEKEILLDNVEDAVYNGPSLEVEMGDVNWELRRRRLR